MRLAFLTLLSLVLVPSALAAGPRAQTISGTISANSGSSITVTSGDRSVTCAVRGQARSLAEGAPVGTPVLIVCAGGDHPALLDLERLQTSTAPSHPSTTSSPLPPPPTTDRRYAKGIVTALSSDGVTVKPDEGGDSLRCNITQAADSASAAAKLSLGAHLGIVCRRDGDSWVLAGSISA
jgi:hypothetical protein